MNTNIIKTLKKYYDRFGIEDEGPSDDIYLYDFIQINKNIKSDLAILKNILENVTIEKHFKVCQYLIEDLANKLSERAIFIEELERIEDKIDFDIDGISNGIIWFQQAQMTNPQHPKGFKDIKIGGIDPFINNMLKIQGSLILQLYIALVYMRSGPVYEILKIGSKNKCQTMNISYKLLNSDYIRHIRNSLSHGTFRMNVAGVYFKDNNYEIVSTPGFLDKICMWIFVLYYQCILFIGNELD